MPPGLGPGDSFVITTTSAEEQGRSFLRARVPAGLRPGDSFLVELPNGLRADVVVPEGVAPGDEISVPYISDSSQPRGGGGDTDRVTLTDREVLEQLTEAEKSFIDALPAEVRADAIEEKRMALQQVLSESANSTPGERRQEQVKVVQVQVPPGVVAGQEFRVMMPDGRAVMVMVPPGVNPGETIGLPASAGLEDTQTEEEDGAPSEEEQRERAAFLAALPPELRDEVLANERRMKAVANANAGGESTSEDNSLLDLNFTEPSTAVPTQPSIVPTQYEVTEPAALSREVDLLSGGSGLAENGQAGVLGVAPVVSQQEALTPQKAPVAPPIPVESATVQTATEGMGSMSLGNGLHETVPKKTESSEVGAKTPLERLREAKLGLEQGRITEEEFHRIKQEVIQGL